MSISLRNIEMVNGVVVAIFDNGARVQAYPGPGGLWYPRGNDVTLPGVGAPDPGEPDPTEPPPPDPVIVANDFKWPFPKSAFNEYNGMSGGGYRPPSRPNHRGLDMSFPPADDGAPIKAIADGTVKFAGWHDDYTPNTSGDLTGGYTVWLDHGRLADGHRYGSLYAHMLNSLQVVTGATVAQGDTLGFLGSTGNSTGPHLHFEIWDYDAVTSPSYDKRINPHTFMATYNPDDLSV